MNVPDRPAPEGMLLEDDDATPARFALSVLAERPACKVDDESEMEFGVLDDLDDRAALRAAAEEPLPMNEADSRTAE